MEPSSSNPLLRQYRRDLGVKLSELRQFIDLLRERTGLRYPLAHFLPAVGEGAKLIVELQTEAGLPGDLWLVALTDQFIWIPVAHDFTRTPSAARPD